MSEVGRTPIDVHPSLGLQRQLRMIWYDSVLILAWFAPQGTLECLEDAGIEKNMRVVL